MREPNPLFLNRSQFVSRVVPACVLTCIAGPRLAFGRTHASGEGEGKHKFDQRLSLELTNRQLLTSKYNDYIALAKALKGELGEARTVEFLKEVTTWRRGSIRTSGWSGTRP